MSRRARWGSTVPAASVPATVTVCFSGTETVSLARAARRRAPCFFSRAPICALPAFLSAVGAASGGSDFQHGVAGWSWPRDHLEGGAGSGLSWRAGSRSGPVSMLSAAVSSSEMLTARRVWGMVRAAWAVTAASRLSVLAAPGVKSATRRTDAPGQVAHREARVPGDRHSQGPDSGGLVPRPPADGCALPGAPTGPAAGTRGWAGPCEPVMDLPAVPVQGGGPALGLAHADADEDIWAAGRVLDTVFRAVQDTPGSTRRRMGGAFARLWERGCLRDRPTIRQKAGVAMQGGVRLEASRAW